VRSELEPLAQLIAIADTDVVARLRLQPTIRDLLASWIRAALVATLLRPFRDEQIEQSGRNQLHSGGYRDDPNPVGAAIGCRQAALLRDRVGLS
jgi:hypothetical protein